MVVPGLNDSLTGVLRILELQRGVAGVYSVRRACMGSILAARRAGI